jgi:hypothetical protein
MVEYLEREIEAVLRQRIGRECLFVASGRLGLYLAFRAWLSPGDRILMSPLNDDVVFFTALAAGLRPVMAPVSIEDGNIEPDRVPDATWFSLSAVLTTNLYGLPDRVHRLQQKCTHLGITLIEDVAHAIETEVDGQIIGTFGPVSVFSLSKHVGARGGILAFADEARRPELMRLRGEVMRSKPWRRLIADAAANAVAITGANLAGRLLRRLRLSRPATMAAHSLGLIERISYRMPLRAQQLQEVITTENLDALDPWVRVDFHDYRTQPKPKLLEHTLARLRNLSSERASRMEGVLRLRRFDAMARGARQGNPLALFRVPLLIEEREAVAVQLRRRFGIGSHYIYDPPLDDYAGPAFAEPSPNPEVARWWAAHVLPIDPLDVGRLLDAFEAIGTDLTPAQFST